MGNTQPSPSKSSQAGREPREEAPPGDRTDLQDRTRHQESPARLPPKVKSAPSLPSHRLSNWLTWDFQICRPSRRMGCLWAPEGAPACLLPIPWSLELINSLTHSRTIY